MNHNPKHWARDVYKTLKAVCFDPSMQAKMQGGDMSHYDETEGDRQIAHKIKAGIPFERL